MMSILYVSVDGRLADTHSARGHTDTHARTHTKARMITNMNVFSLNDHERQPVKQLLKHDENVTSLRQ